MIVLSNTNFGNREVERIKGADVEYFYVDYGVEGLMNLPEWVRKNARILIGSPHQITEEFLELCPQIRWVHQTWAGIDSGTQRLDWDFLSKHHIVVTTSKIHGIPISEMILTYMLMLAKDMKKYHENQKNKLFKRYNSAILLNNQTGLILGTGHIGSEAARKMKLGFNMTTIGINMDGRQVEYFDEIYTLDRLDEILPICDYVILTLPLTNRTENIINKNTLGRMKKTAYLINVSRGHHVVEEDLVEALKTGQIAGAALDAFREEPLEASSPLWDLENVILTPHMSGGFPGYYDRVIDLFINNMIYFRKEQLSKMNNIANIKGY